MSKEEYLEIRNNPAQDVMPVLSFFFNLKARTKLSPMVFNKLFSQWLLTSSALPLLGQIIYKVFKELDIYFLVN